MGVLITGPFGRVGTPLIDQLQDSFDLIYFDREEHPSYPTIVGDIADYSQFSNAMCGVDALIHLAAAAELDSSWPELLQANIIGAYNAFEAAHRNDVERVIFPSSNHVVGMYEEEHSPQLYNLDYDLTLDKDVPPRPDSLYACTKIFNEALGRYYVENFEYPKRVYMLRIGSVRSPDKDHPYADAETGVEQGDWSRDSQEYQNQVKRLKATWLSHRDLGQIIEACLTDTNVTYDVFYATSDNDRGWLDIEYAKTVLDYEPKDNGENWDEPPSHHRV